MYICWWWRNQKQRARKVSILEQNNFLLYTIYKGVGAWLGRRGGYTSNILLEGFRYDFFVVLSAVVIATSFTSACRHTHRKLQIEGGYPAIFNKWLSAIFKCMRRRWRTDFCLRTHLKTRRIKEIILQRARTYIE